MSHDCKTQWAGYVLIAAWLVVPACASKVADTKVAPDAEQAPQALVQGPSVPILIDDVVILAPLPPPPPPPGGSGAAGVGGGAGAAGSPPPPPNCSPGNPCKETFTVSFPSVKDQVSFTEVRFNVLAAIGSGPIQEVSPNGTAKTRTVELTAPTGSRVTFTSNATNASVTGTFDGRADALTLGCTGMVWLSTQNSCFSCNGFGAGTCVNCINSGPCFLQPVGSGGPGCPSSPSNIDVACKCGTIRLVSDTGPSDGNARQQRYVCE